MAIPEEREYIVYLETDVTVRATTLREAERMAHEYIEAFLKLHHAGGRKIQIDDTRIITSEYKRLTDNSRRHREKVSQNR